jgi:hypothetical protein
LIFRETVISWTNQPSELKHSSFFSSFGMLGGCGGHVNRQSCQNDSKFLSHGS